MRQSSWIISFNYKIFICWMIGCCCQWMKKPALYQSYSPAPALPCAAPRASVAAPPQTTSCQYFSDNGSKTSCSRSTTAARATQWGETLDRLDIRCSWSTFSWWWCCSGVTKKHQKFIFEYWVFSQKSYLNVWCFEKVHICIPKIPYLHTKKFYICILLHILIFWL